MRLTFRRQYVDIVATFYVVAVCGVSLRASRGPAVMAVLLAWIACMRLFIPPADYREDGIILGVALVLALAATRPRGRSRHHSDLSDRLALADVI
ncbi:MAG TPA: hypothetical protein VIC85_12035, partial [Ktedonobacterales bacterium]